MTSRESRRIGASTSLAFTGLAFDGARGGLRCQGCGQALSSAPWIALLYLSGANGSFSTEVFAIVPPPLALQRSEAFRTVLPLELFSACCYSA
jgi:hypothetical protein